MNARIGLADAVALMLMWRKLRFKRGSWFLIIMLLLTPLWVTLASAAIFWMIVLIKVNTQPDFRDQPVTEHPVHYEYGDPTFSPPP